MKRFNWQNIRLVLILFVMVFLFSFSSHRNDKRAIKSITISFFGGDENLFITHEMVNNLLKQNLGGTLTIKKEEVDLKSLETALNNHKMIEKCEIFSTIDGSLNTNIKQKTPIVRYVSGNTMYYLDNKGINIPLSENFSARVPIVMGNFDDENKDNYVLLFNEIYKDDFLKKNITGIKILPSGSVILTNRNYDYKIIFGKPVYVEKKLKNYKAFFHHAVKDTLIKNYKEVNVMFTEQVVCKK
ncbi:cell division protein FtsQ [Flavobacterium jejuense]|uniref:Cell division protein FtsQ n=1 Tax=Flavobacterium jejuense TaxID=1544455 RepID=A0ABX0ISG5_9FLAO|nr:cell division protein FtsQ [Flavobacterium jejuense]NHN26478.1 cell division protein FtsQ [Flavobacterium jejuense]